MTTQFQMIFLLLSVTGFVINVPAQEVSIPDPGLNAAIRETLGTPDGPLTVQDLLRLTDLDAFSRGVSSLEGLGAAQNLATLNLGGNQLTSLTVPAGLTSLTTLDLSFNPLTDFSFLSGLTSLTMLGLHGSQLTSLTLPPGLTSLTTLDISDNQLTDFTFLSGLTGLTTLYLWGNQLTGLTLPPGLTNLTSLDLSGNQLTDFSFLSGLTSLTTLNLDGNQLTSLSLPEGLTSLTTLGLGANQLASLTLPADLTNLTSLDLNANPLTSLALPGLTSLTELKVCCGNQLTDFSFLGGLTSLTTLDLDSNQLTSLTLPAGLTSLTTLDLGENPLMTLVLSEQLAATGLADEVALLTSQGVSVSLYPSPPAEDASIPDFGLNAAIRETLGKTAGPLTMEDLLGLTSLDASNRGVSSLEGLGAAHNLTTLYLHNNQLTNLTLPTGLTSLTTLVLYNNQLTSLTLPAGLTTLTTLDLGGNPLMTLVLSEQLAATGLADEVALLTSQGVSVSLYPSPPAESVLIPDPGLNTAIRETLGKTAGPLTAEDLLGLTSLDASNRGVSSLEGLGAAHNLTTLYLNDNQLIDFSLPMGLTNLTTLNLHNNQLTNLTLPPGLTTLTRLDLGGNPLMIFVLSEQLAATGLANEVALLTSQGISVSLYPSPPGESALIPDPGLNTAIRETLGKTAGPLTAEDLLGLTSLDASNRGVSSLEGLGVAHNLTTLNLNDNQPIDFSLPVGLTNLTTLVLYNNHLTSLTLPPGLTSLTTLVLYNNHLTSLTLPAGLTTLTTLVLNNNQLTSLTLPPGLTTLTTLDLGGNPLMTLVLSEQLAATGLADEVALLTSQGVWVSLYPSPPTQSASIPDPGLSTAIRETLGKTAGPLTAEDLLGLASLDASNRGVSSLEGLGAAHNLTTLYLNDNQLIDFSLPMGLTNLTLLNLHNNQLTNLTLPTGLTSLTSLVLYNNQLTSLTLPAGLTSLTSLDLRYTQLTSLTLPAGLTSLTSLSLDGNPLLKTFVLSEQLAATGLADEVASLRGQGVSVYAYPSAVSLASGQHTTAGAFELTLSGPPGAYTILGSADLAGWSELGTLTNELVIAVFTDLTVTNSLQKFYRARAAP